VSLVDDAIAEVRPIYRAQIRELLEAWLKCQPLIQYDARIKQGIEAAMVRYAAEVDRCDMRKEGLFKIARQRYFRETRRECPSPEVQNVLSNEPWLELSICFGYVALAWQMANFPRDLILTAHGMATRYPINAA
jgi:hypothetical protein